MRAPRWTSTNVPMRVPSPIEQPYRFVNAWTTTPLPNSTSATSRYGATFAGSEERADTFDDRLDLRLGDAREDRQRDDATGRPLRDGERSLEMAEVAVGLRQVRGLRIVKARSDLALAQVQGERLRVCRPDHVEMPDRVAVRGDRRQLDIPHSGERLRVQGRSRATLGVPHVEQRELVREHDRLDRVEPRGEADHLVVVLRALPVLAQRLHACDEIVIVGDQRAGVAECAEILAGIEAE